MYLRNLRIQNVKRLRDFELDFTKPDGSPRMWTVLIGENGTAKTTILQSVALASAGSLLVNELGGRLVPHLRDRRAPKKTAQLRAEFGFGSFSGEDEWHPIWRQLVGDARPPKRVLSEVSLAPKETTLRGQARYLDVKESPKDPLVDARATNHRPGWFVVGYGTTRLPPDPGAAVDLSRAQIQRMLPLINPKTGLTSTSFLSHFGPRTKRSRQFSKMIQEVLINSGILPEDILHLELRGSGGVTRPEDLIEREKFTQRMGPDEVKVPLAAFANGLQSTIGWVADLVGHVLLEADTKVGADEIEGIVLLDEIDLYLHPKWQIDIIGALRRVFQRVQFIVTTHNPGLLSSFAPEEIVRLSVDPTDGYVKRFAHDEHTGVLEPVDSPGDVAAQPDPRMLTGSEILEDYFGLDAGPLNPQGALRRERDALLGSPWRTPAQDARLRELSALLDATGEGE